MFDVDDLQANTGAAPWSLDDYAQDGWHQIEVGIDSCSAVSCIREDQLYGNEVTPLKSDHNGFKSASGGMVMPVGDHETTGCVRF